MSALADQLVAAGKYLNTTIADAAISAGQVVRDSNGQVRCAGSATPIQPNPETKSGADSLTVLPGGYSPPKKGSGNNKW